MYNKGFFAATNWPSRNMHFLEHANIRECFLCWPQEKQFAIRYITQWGQSDTSTRKESCYNKYPWWISLNIFWHLKNIHLPSIYLATAKLERPCNHILRLVWVILYPIINNIVFLYFFDIIMCSRPMVSMLHEWKRMIFWTNVPSWPCIRITTWYMVIGGWLLRRATCAPAFSLLL